MLLSPSNAHNYINNEKGEVMAWLQEAIEMAHKVCRKN